MPWKFLPAVSSNQTCHENWPRWQPSDTLPTQVTQPKSKRLSFGHDVTWRVLFPAPEMEGEYRLGYPPLPAVETTIITFIFQASIFRWDFEVRLEGDETEMPVEDCQFNLWDEWKVYFTYMDWLDFVWFSCRHIFDHPWITCKRIIKGDFPGPPRTFGPLEMVSWTHTIPLPISSGNSGLGRLHGAHLP